MNNNNNKIEVFSQKSSVWRAGVHDSSEDISTARLKFAFLASRVLNFWPFLCLNKKHLCIKDIVTSKSPALFALSSVLGGSGHHVDSRVTQSGKKQANKEHTYRGRCVVTLDSRISWRSQQSSVRSAGGDGGQVIQDETKQPIRIWRGSFMAFMASWPHFIKKRWDVPHDCVITAAHAN